MIKKIIEKIKYELQFNNPHYYRRISEKIFKTNYQRLLRKKLSKLSPITPDKENAKLTVATLANKKRFYESVAALYSFCFWKRDICLHYHEDGTLTEKNIDFLKKLFPGITIFRRREQNLKVKDQLLSKGLSNCAQLRGEFFLSIKLFDMIYEKNTPYLLHIDSDVLFFSRPDEILNIIEEGNFNGCYNVDVDIAYSFDNVTIAKYIYVPMINRFNSGLLLHNFNEELFDFVDAVMKDNHQSKSPWHLEQTLLAMYASYKGNFLGLPESYDLGRRQKKLGNKITSEHYVHNTGYEFHKDFIYKISPLYKSSKKTN